MSQSSESVSKRQPTNPQRDGVFACWMLVLATTFSTATVLRFPGIPLGPGEVLLVVWLSLVLMRRATRGSSLLSGTARPFVAFWAAALSLLMLGYAIAVMFYGYYAVGALHDTVAYGLMAVFSITLASELTKGSGETSLRRYYSFVSALLIGLLLLGLAMGQGSKPFWYGSRFHGWANDPNQLAFQVVAAPFVLLHFASKESGIKRIGLFLLAGASVLVGLATESDSLVVAWPFATLVGVVHMYGVQGWSKGHTYWGGLLRLVILPVTVGGVLLVVGGALIDALWSGAREVYASGGQGASRITLWMHGLGALAKSPFAGLGPGAHSGVWGPLGGAESHSSYIQWATNTGLLGLAGLLTLLALILKRCWATRSVWLLMAVSAYGALFLFHSALRHPSMWLTLVCIVAITDPRSEAHRV